MDIGQEGQFTIFAKLPPELRNEIWRLSLPDRIGRALHCFRSGCWSVTEAEYQQGDQLENTYVKYRFLPERLSRVEYKLPLAHVNHEARGVAHAWARQQDGKILQHDPEESALRGYPVFVCSFDIDRDVLYVLPEEWDEFVEPASFALDIDSSNIVRDLETDFSRIAFPELAFDVVEDMQISNIFRCSPEVNRLFIVLDDPPGLEPAENDGDVQPRWELRCTKGGGCLWNGEEFAYMGDHESEDEKQDLRVWIDFLDQNMFGEDLLAEECSYFEIRLAHAVMPSSAG